MTMVVPGSKQKPVDRTVNICSSKKPMTAVAADQCLAFPWSEVLLSLMPMASSAWLHSQLVPTRGR